ncbi:hypothetical protein TcasGA2_TC031921 [Tribolium castaneum]|uniref:Uncharacterized protein n=1 Tax=Tribolium castaneum TaxID=7070 RepID=A0A139W9U7_TRICA|nr:hypothetical protein TcasGA2_TC031921 [Tribolium castaneum]
MTVLSHCLFLETGRLSSVSPRVIPHPRVPPDITLPPGRQSLLGLYYLKLT